MESSNNQQVFNAEALLGADAVIFERITALREGFQYTTGGEKTSFDGYFATLRQAVDAIPQLVLDTDVPPGTENQYAIHLASTMEQIVDDADRVLRKLAHYQGRLRDAERQIENIKAEFIAWYLLAANPIVKSIKLPAKAAHGLAAAEFSRLMDNLDIRVMSLLDDLKIEFDRVATHKAAQREKHDLGKDQANASWTSVLPAFGGAISENRSHLTQPQDADEEDEEEVPQFVSRRTPITGTFRKTLTAVAQPVKDEDGNSVVCSKEYLANVERLSPFETDAQVEARVSARLHQTSHEEL